MSSTQVFETENDQKVIADVAGPAHGKSVLFMHGAGQTRHSWKSALPLFAAVGYRAYALDARGHGDSDWAKDGDYSPEALARDLNAVLRQLRDLPFLVGASMGGLTSLYALGVADKPIARGLVLVDITPRVDMAGAERVTGFMRSNAEGFASLEEAAASLASYNPHRPPPTDVSRLARNLRRRGDRWFWHWDPAFMRLAGFDDEFWRMLERGAEKAVMPTLLVRGAHSDIVGKDEVAHFRQAIPHAEYFDVEGAGHMVVGDKNDVFTNAIVEFVRRTDDAH